jgi:hypothetical protein
MFPVLLTVKFVAVTAPPTNSPPPNPAPPLTIRAPVVVEKVLEFDWIVAVVTTNRPFLTIKSLDNDCAISFPFHVTAVT